MAGMKTLEVPPIRIWATMTGQNEGHSAITNAPAASAATAAATSARFDRSEVDERTRRCLRQNPCDPADRERQPHALLVPSVAGEVNREERPHPGLHVGQEEIQTIEPTERPPRRLLRTLRPSLHNRRPQRAVVSSSPGGGSECSEKQRIAFSWAMVFI